MHRILFASLVCLSTLASETYKIDATNETVTLGLFDIKNSCLHTMVYNKTTPADVAVFYKKNDIQKRRGMHSLTGPVYVDGAEPGDVLEIRILDIKLNDFGYNFLSPTQGILTEFRKPQIKYFKFDKTNMTSQFSENQITENWRTK